MLTLHKLARVVHGLQKKHITQGKARRFWHGVSTLSATPFVSLNAAGRQLSPVRSTGENRIRRTIDDQKLSGQLQRLLVYEAFAGRSGYFYCSLDHSQFGPFCIAVLAVSVRKGRAIPVWCQVNVSEGALIAPLLAELEALLAFLAQIAPGLRLVLVMDRWFASNRLFTLLTGHGAYFIARTKGDKLVQLPWDPSWWKEPIGDLSHEELEITYRKHKLRLIRSDFREGMKDTEPWFLLTNLPEPTHKGSADGATRRQILNRYAERFEIEEAFKDLKWLNRLEWQQVRKPDVIRSLLLFTFFGWWLLYRHRSRQAERNNAMLHPKKQLSWYRLAWEELQRLLRTPLQPPPAVALVLRGGMEK